jgi:hypothetical protein
MPNEPNRPRQDCKSAVPEFWNVSFYHRIVRTTIGEELKATYHVPQELPHNLFVLLMQMNEQRPKILTGAAADDEDNTATS